MWVLDVETARPLHTPASPFVCVGVAVFEITDRKQWKYVVTFIQAEVCNSYRHIGIGCCNVKFQ